MVWDAARARGLLAELWPEWAFGTVRPLSSAGWDFVTFLVDEQWVVRIARRADARIRLAYETRKLCQVRQGTFGLPVPIPFYERTARVAGVYRQLAGKPARALSSPVAEMLGRQVGRFLRVWHGPALWPRGLDTGRAAARWLSRWERILQDANQELWPMLAIKERRRCHGAAAALLARARAFTPVLLHGDMQPGHILHEGGLITGILDFADMRVGDPAFDFCGLQGMRRGALAEYGRPLDAERIPLYQWAGQTAAALDALARGDVEAVERSMTLIRRAIPN
ncbi:MAG: phosphotransferase [Thermaerobacter sp.]|nr:phosphotransferase [Thermaerobacter sp.]